MPETDIHDLLAEGLDGCLRREAAAYDLAAKDTDGVVLSGAGRLGQKILLALRAAGQEPLAICDNNRELWGTSVLGLAVMPPEEAAAQYGETALFVITTWASWHKSMISQVRVLEGFGCRRVIPFLLLAWKYHEALLPHVQVDLPSKVHRQKERVLKLADLWRDEDSLLEYAAQVRWRLFADFACLRPPRTSQYWQPDLINFYEAKVFIDAGAFNGDTMAEFVDVTGSRFQNIYAFEPDSANFQALENRVNRLPEGMQKRVCAQRRAVSNYNGTLPFSQGLGSGSKVGGLTKVECVRLDSVVNEAPCFIKYDVEGSEAEALEGSRTLIDRFRPALAVCVYHQQDHLWALPLQIHAMNPDYKLSLRSHGQVWDTVCYATA